MKDLFISRLLNKISNDNLCSINGGDKMFHYLKKCNHTIKYVFDQKTKTEHLFFYGCCLLLLNYYNSSSNSKYNNISRNPTKKVHQMTYVTK